MKPILIKENDTNVLTTMYTVTGSLSPHHVAVDYLIAGTSSRVMLSLSMDSLLTQLFAFPNPCVDLRPYCVQA